MNGQKNNCDFNRGHNLHLGFDVDTLSCHPVLHYAAVRAAIRRYYYYYYYYDIILNICMYISIIRCALHIYMYIFWRIIH